MSFNKLLTAINSRHIILSKVHETTLEEKLRSLELEKEAQNEELRAKLAESEEKIREMETKEDSEPETGPLEEQLTGHFCNF